MNGGMMLVRACSCKFFNLSFENFKGSHFMLSTTPFFKSSPAIMAMSTTQGTGKEGEKRYRGPIPKKNIIEEWIWKNENVVRTSPIYVGCMSLAAIILNRSLSGISPIVDASSSQSRADVLTLALAVTVIFTGLVWISIQPKYLPPVQLQGIECNIVEEALPAKTAAELYWVWESLADITCCQALVIVYDGHCFLQVGLAAESATVKGKAMQVDAGKLMQGSLCQEIWRSGKQNYLANLVLYPGRLELPFLPQNTQAVILQPLGDKGVMVVAGDTIRGFSESDQFRAPVSSNSVRAELFWSNVCCGFVRMISVINFVFEMIGPTYGKHFIILFQFAFGFVIRLS
ncbi:protein COFACTOR ASSEMBLY OF COMPLEX C SUBUNIT B CCB4, chloroplastic isoform X2 [Cryptomeria japonica]|uniref:protein COFACTOR ASSEMBLY OF COMPLEX C SUBUNIT B CCB4, chloroplastic isoform X2 n=1 Tax=Cryptomeria japonica TaxID=3369 RepID=UPI0025ABB532|nr:protein COFACTOR ASSEMBLY OF COMPLEX C SUBUNIT B CCB4, chloroplastic isoform X2 [Cryptomeria japonica]